MRNLFKVCILVIAFIGVTAFSAMATPIVGDISFSGTSETDSQDMLLAKSFISFSNVTVSGAGSGDYPVSLIGHEATFTPFTFDPMLSPNPLAPPWMLTEGEIIYSFDATGLTISLGRSSNLLSMYGNGIAHITGYDDTAANWSLSANRSGSTGSFSASTGTASVPEPATMLLLGTGLIGLATFGTRKFLKK